MKKETSQEMAAAAGLPMTVVQPTLVAYRSVGIGVFGAVMRFAGMPLEKIALFMNSSQVSAGRGQFRRAARLTFQEGWLAPYRVVGPASVTAWFLQYSVMGIAFQFFDQTLSRMLGVRPVYYGKELMEPATTAQQQQQPLDYQVKSTACRLLSPVMAACLESYVSNRAEVQRYFGPDKLAALERDVLNLRGLRRAAGPAFGANAARNVIMCQTSFLLTPVTYKLYFPQEHKNKTTLFWYGLALNVVVGNAFAITQQALWGRSLDFLAATGQIEYGAVVQRGLAEEGLRAFFTLPKWFSRVLMNAPAQGTLPWFYNEVLPLGEQGVLSVVKSFVYDPFLETSEPAAIAIPQRAHQHLMLTTPKMATSVAAAAFSSSPSAQQR